MSSPPVEAAKGVPPPNTCEGSVLSQLCLSDSRGPAETTHMGHSIYMLGGPTFTGDSLPAKVLSERVIVSRDSLFRPHGLFVGSLDDCLVFVYIMSFSLVFSTSANPPFCEVFHNMSRP